MFTPNDLKSFITTSCSRCSVVSCERTYFSVAHQESFLAFGCFNFGFPSSSSSSSSSVSSSDELSSGNTFKRKNFSLSAMICATCWTNDLHFCGYNYFIFRKFPENEPLLQKSIRFWLIVAFSFLREVGKSKSGKF